jgi:hypothetical protein
MTASLTIHEFVFIHWERERYGRYLCGCLS